MTVKATIQVRGNPLRQAYVEHIVGGVGQGMYMTDVNGEIRDKDFNAGIDSKDKADIRIICQNPILRALNGDALNIGVYKDKVIVDGATINLETNADQDDYFAILNRAQITYEIVFQPLSFFQELPKPEFPLGLKKTSLRDTRDQPERIDLIYPDHSIAPVAWTEPKRLGDDFPLMHIKARSTDGRLLQVGELPIVHEVAHAIHFIFLTKTQRRNAQDKFAQFIVTDFVSGGGGTHTIAKRTTAEVAYIEAAGIFSENFIEFMRRRQGGGSPQPEPITPTIEAEWVEQAEFVETEGVQLKRVSKVIAMISFGTGVITAFSGAGIYFSPDGQNLGGGGSTTRVYGENETLVAMIPFRNGVITAFSETGIYFSPDGQNLGGGGSTTRVYGGNQKVVAMIPFRNGVITAFSGGGIYSSPAGENLGGGGSTTQVYGGNQTVVAMIPFRNGVITAFSGGGIYSSRAGENLGGGGSTTQVYGGNQTVVAMIPFRNGVITAFSGGGIYFSPDGQNLGGGGSTTQVYGGNQTVVAMIPFRNDSVVPPRNEVITAFSGGGIYRSPDGQNLGGGGSTTQVYGGNQTVVAMIPFRNDSVVPPRNEVITAFSGGGIYRSPDGQNLGGGGSTTHVPAARVPTLTGVDVEGAVYGAIFVDFASFVGLDSAASSYFKANAINFGQYRKFIKDNHPDQFETLEQIRRDWRL